jgi:hypothetical protein
LRERGREREGEGEGEGEGEREREREREREMQCCHQCNKCIRLQEFLPLIYLYNLKLSFIGI